MNVLKVKKGETLARKQDKVMEWYLIQEGSVIRQFAFAEIIMHRNAIVGILENEWFACDYVANEDTTLIVIPCKNAQDLRKILSEHENFRPIFLRTAVEQRHQAASVVCWRTSILPVTAAEISALRRSCSNVIAF